MISFLYRLLSLITLSITLASANERRVIGTLIRRNLYKQIRRTVR